MKSAYRHLLGLFSMIALGVSGSTPAEPAVASGTGAVSHEAPPAMATVSHLHDFQVVELRRYTTTHGGRARFADYFDTYFPEAFEQLGAMVFGQFLPREHPDQFVWLRGFHDMPARPVVNSQFYYGPLWREHRLKVNALLPDSDNVLLLRPLRPDTGVDVLPAVDPVDEPHGAQGIVVMQIFAVKKGDEDVLATHAEAQFESYRVAGVHPAGILVTLDEPNNFPQLPVRMDGPWLVWLGVVRDEATLRKQLQPAMQAAAKTLLASGMLRAAPELLAMDPTPRSRLRWLPDAGEAAR
ncbi:NIPSNAP family protein [Rhodanobacter sp. DHG33]|uniref:NIPSNAP family protein n=1 Tax=Rhodanobacter sp. DHG33 TaxID=2775921 RepID=UPI00177F0216|nr:NIPSNAP family protein [Rhodanobacter sp. DHG33]MBD8900544.1 NIPSNAP family protein [Rhodanobacter sp. DHG33]